MGAHSPADQQTFTQVVAEQRRQRRAVTWGTESNQRRCRCRSGPRGGEASRGSAETAALLTQQPAELVGRQRLEGLVGGREEGERPLLAQQRTHSCCVQGGEQEAEDGNSRLLLGRRTTGVNR